MTAAAAVRSGRRAIEALMVDACTIARPGAGQGIVNDATLQLTPPPSTQVYAGKCRVRPQNLADRQVETEERRATVQHLVVSIPTTAPDVDVDDVVTVTACSLDAQLVGHTFTILGIAQGSHLTARRLSCRELAS